jgi:murein DD-endopeptidase MepM/ murein hydrolase activator NlpD/GH24 family phage-related lysozyme (muramidase)
MDDFDYDENKEQELEQLQQQNDTSMTERARNVKDKYDNAKDNIEKAKKFRQGARQGAKGVGKEAGKEATKGAAKGAGKEAAKGVAKEGAKAAGKEAAKTAGKVAAKEGAKAAAKGALAASGAATAGIGTAAAAAIEVADRLKQISKKMDKAIEEKTGINVKKTKKVVLLAFIMAPVLIFIMIISGTMYLASENTYEDLYGIIKKRQTRYAESGKPFKSVLLMTNAEVNEILTRDYLESGQSISDEDYTALDLSYKTYLKNIYGTEYDDFIPSDSVDPTSSYSEKIAIIEKYLKASRTNFNKIKWVTSSSNTLDIKKYDLTDNLEGPSIPGIAAALLNSTDNYLQMPDVAKYKFSPSATSDQMKSMYLDMVERYLQPWVVPYALNIASQNNAFGKSVLDDMFHPITVTLFELNRLTRTTVTYYYLATTVNVDYYTGSTTCISDGLGGVSCSTTYTYSYSDSFPSTTATTWTSSETAKYSVSLQTDSTGYIRADVKTGPAVDRDTRIYRHVPKLTYAETFYEVITGNYSVDPISEANVPVETSTNLDANGKEIIIDIWDEGLIDNGGTSKPYKVSYNGGETYPRKSTAQKEQIKLKYIGTNTVKPVVQGYSYADLDFGYSQIEKYYGLASTGGVIGSGSLTTIPAGGFAWPVPAILGSGVNIDTTIASPFGSRTHPITGVVSSFHPALDIGAMGIGSGGTDKDTSYGPDIVAAQKGIIHVKSDPNGYGPQYIVIDHQNGYSTLYGHLFSICVTNGQEVAQGQKIGVMGTKGSSTGVHLHFGIYQTGTVDALNNSLAIDPRKVFNNDGSSLGGVTGSTATTAPTTSGQTVIDQMCAKAIDMAENTRNITYTSPPANRDRDTIAELSLPNWYTDCSGYVSAMYKAYVGIDVGTWTGAMHDKAVAGYTENGWKAEFHDWNGDTSVLLPGDMLWRSTHVGLYVGNGKQVDNGGSPATGPNYKQASTTYTGYIRYTNPNVVTPTPGGTPTTPSITTKKISRVEWYLDFQTATNDLTGNGGGGGGGGPHGSSDLFSYLLLAEGGTNFLSPDGTKYRVHNDGAGIPTVGMGVAIKYNLAAFASFGIDGTTLNFGDYVDKTIVDSIAQIEVDSNLKYVTDLLANNNIVLEDYQITVLVSRTYNVGNVNGFPAAWRQYGLTQALYDNYLGKPITGQGVGVLAGLVKRRQVEWELFKTGVYPDSVY